MVMLAAFLALAVWMFGGAITSAEPHSSAGVGGSRQAAGSGESVDPGELVAAETPEGEDAAVPADVVRPAASDTVSDTTPDAAAVARAGTRGNAAHVDPAWASEQAARTGIPLRALLGYAGAELAMRSEAPGCRIGWSTLAAIGRLESGHGTHGRSSLGDDGVARPAILGPDLDGEQFDRIDDTDGGVLDGSPATDRAVGPMQFIPSTWQEWRADGNADGIADPQQIDDVSLAAARYLCNSGDLSDPAAWRSAVFAYNHVDAYVDAVAAAASDYAERARG
ncbi:hypothetical protein GCM10023152_14000 [Agromyces bauzanensis]|uniref:Murein transglycosylase n=2 Tax=Agromyces bauzanensis TaxID=1308924 RepID=A0A917PF34_9MICO|nr:hypothetical protein GCM10011372_08950 [Agromyces bauzanensis]